VNAGTPELLAPGLWRWLAPHPDWKPPVERGSPDDWDELVGSVLYLLEDVAVLIDPLLPAEPAREPHEQWLDEQIGARAVSVLTTVRWHSRDRVLLAERYAGRSRGAWNAVPHGVEQHPVKGGGETIYWLPGAAALVPGDLLIGAQGGGIRVCPESWLEDVRVDRAGAARLMRPLLELAVERVLVSHGEPVLHDGRAALARALDEASG
jgi:hypothetical protein